MKRTTLAALATAMAMIMPSVASAQTTDEPAPIVIDDATIDQFQLMVRSFMRLYLGATVDSDAFQIRLRECITTALQTQSRIQLREHAKEAANDGDQGTREQNQEQSREQSRTQNSGDSGLGFKAWTEDGRRQISLEAYHGADYGNGVGSDGQNQWGKSETE